jgi:ketosteroid isomerase-like protein
VTAIPPGDRLALEDLLVAYAHAIDTMGDPASVLALFTADAVYDLTGIGLARLEGHEAIGAFCSTVFANMAHQAHYLSNFAVTAYAGDTASVRAYVNGMGLGKDGARVSAQGRYHFDLVRTPAGWKAARYAMDFLMPLSGTLDNAR